MLALSRWVKITLACIVTAAFGWVVLTVLLWAAPAPNLMDHTGYSTAWFDRNGELLRLTLAPDDRYRLWTPLEQIAPTLIESTLLYEDRRFYQHSGVDFIALTRAAFGFFLPNSRRVGASTITMQLVRLHDQLNTRTLSGKSKQLWRALVIERHYSKTEILEAYLNLAPYGGNIEGVGAASLIYFHQKAAALNLQQAMLLSVIPQNPSQRHPITGHRPSLLAARERLFALWLEQHPTDTKQQAAFALPLQLFTLKQIPYHAPHFIDRLVKEQLGKEQTLALPTKDLKQRDGTLITTLDLSIQNRIEMLTRNHIERQYPLGIRNGAVLLIHAPTMEIVAEVGSANFFDNSIHGQVNGTHAPRSPGSALKPFIYALALQQGLIHPKSLLKDTPHRFATYTPENFDQRFVGPLSATDALIQSRNVPAVLLHQQLGEQGLHALLAQAEIAQLKDADHYGLALALGGMELTMNEMAQLYAMLVNNGVHLKSRSLLSQTVEHTQEQNHTQEQDLEPADNQLLTPEAAWLVRMMLSQNPSPTQNRFSITSASTPIAWKTGTSYSYRDAWSVGVIGPWVLAVWIGNFSGEGNPAIVGRSVAAPLFFQIARNLPTTFATAQQPILPNVSPFNPQQPPSDINITQVQLCRRTGQLPEKDCPATESSWFIPGISPIKISHVFRKLPVDKDTGLLSCPPYLAESQEELFEFWPSDFLALWKMAGLAVRTPPAWMPECLFQLPELNTPPPEITSPQKGLIYLHTAAGDHHPIPFQANAYPPAKKLYWFIDSQFIGQTDLTTPLLWMPTPGTYQVTVVNDLGQGSSTNLTVNYLVTP